MYPSRKIWDGSPASAPDARSRRQSQPPLIITWGDPDEPAVRIRDIPIDDRRNGIPRDQRRQIPPSVRPSKPKPDYDTSSRTTLRSAVSKIWTRTPADITKKGASENPVILNVWPEMEDWSQVDRRIPSHSPVDGSRVNESWSQRLSVIRSYTRNLLLINRRK